MLERRKDCRSLTDDELIELLRLGECLSEFTRRYSELAISLMEIAQRHLGDSGNDNSWFTAARVDEAAEVSLVLVIEDLAPDLVAPGTLRYRMRQARIARGWGEHVPQRPLPAQHRTLRSLVVTATELVALWLWRKERQKQP